MIVVQLTGGMGNQMFQYSVGRHLAIKNKTVLKLDVSFFETYEWHEYSLAPFCLEASIATEQELRGYKNTNISLWQRFLKKFKIASDIKFAKIVESGLEFHPDVLDVPDNTYLEGYFQSEKYFDAIKAQIKKELSIKILPTPANQLIIDQIKSSNSVSLHIRRGVYASVPEVNKAHGLKPLAYYYDSLDFIKSKTNDFTVFVFSDDIVWAKENLKLETNHVFVDQNNDKTDYEDIRMMSLCKHNILANSTFSWWAAWLNENPEKIVIAPKVWYNDTSRNTQDLIPEGWVRI